jgi:hypothetical protein
MTNTTPSLAQSPREQNPLRRHYCQRASPFSGEPRPPLDLLLHLLLYLDLAPLPDMVLSLLAHQIDVHDLAWISLSAAETSTKNF